MTEEEWRSSTDPRAMCEFVRTATTSWKTRWLGWMKTRRFQVSDRKWRLIERARRLLEGDSMAPRRQARNADLADAVRDVLGHLFLPTALIPPG